MAESRRIRSTTFLSSRYHDKRRNSAKQNNSQDSQKTHGNYKRKRYKLFKRSSSYYKNGLNWSSNDSISRAPHVKKTLMRVASKKVGKIIGRQGSQIKELQTSTGTLIFIGKEDFDGKVDITLIGPEECQEKCKEMIEKLLDENRIASLNNLIKATDYELDDDVPVIDWDAVNKLSEEYEKERWAKCQPVKKNFYFEDPEVAKFDKRYVENMRKSLNNITVSYAFDGEGPIPNPVKTFKQAFHKYPEIMREIDRQGFSKPFPIQCQAWPILLSGYDMIGISQTGTGKTLSYLFPALIHTYGQDIPISQRAGSNVLIIAPTRELALQIDKEVHKYKYRNIESVCLYGGGNRRTQVKLVMKGVHIIIATPGRLIDLIEAGVVNVKSVTYLVLDEADRMLDLGFEPQIRKILLDIRPDRQTVMTSATWPLAVQSLARRYMNNPIQVIVGSLDLAAVHSVKQTIIIMKEEHKMSYLLDQLENLSEEDKIIVFVDRKATADALSCDLILQHINCQSIHGDREQFDREQAIDDLITGVVRILIATDVASRGIDICDVTKVLNYDFPRNVEEYVHRVGRTGRAGKSGEAITFFTRNDWSYAKDLISILEEADQEIPEELIAMRHRYEATRERRSKGKFSHRGRIEDIMFSCRGKKW